MTPSLQNPLGSCSAAEIHQPLCTVSCSCRPYSRPYGPHVTLRHIERCIASVPGSKAITCSAAQSTCTRGSSTTQRPYRKCKLLYARPTAIQPHEVTTYVSRNVQCQPVQNNRAQSTSLICCWVIISSFPITPMSLFSKPYRACSTGLSRSRGGPYVLAEELDHVASHPEDDAAASTNGPGFIIPRRAQLLAGRHVMQYSIPGLQLSIRAGRIKHMFLELGLKAVQSSEPGPQASTVYKRGCQYFF